MILFKKFIRGAVTTAILMVSFPALAQCEPLDNSFLSPFKRVSCQAGFFAAGDPGEYTAYDIALIAGDVISIILGFVGVVFIGLTIYGGFQWMLARGNSDQVRDAQDLIRNSIIGIVIIFAAFAITQSLLINLSNIFAPEGF